MSDENHSRFLSHLDSSAAGVLTVANWLTGRGHDVVVKSSSRAEKHEDWEDHTDSGDLYLMQRIEVKQLSVDFTTNRWPFGDKFIVCAKHSYDRANPKPFAYVILSADSRFAAIVKTSTRCSWYTESRTDRRYNDVSQLFYLCPMSEVSFVEI